ncbi:hypothetical protein RCF34_21295 [Pseudomonas sp. 102515]|uniref:hypothetical protein n=1 Tax=Pseudomonas sp. 102515 TaxID=3071568 RepID=UPI002802FB0B|nr:hypothetical protein [Pseudomonas sp. 102515]MDQ7915650.1 hypothetical protein [Pseudomonas sp. 102515]
MAPRDNVHPNDFGHDAVKDVVSPTSSCCRIGRRVDVLEQYRTAALAVATVVLLALGALVGADVIQWLTADHYQPTAKDFQDEVDAAVSVLASSRTSDTL